MRRVNLYMMRILNKQIYNTNGMGRSIIFFSYFFDSLYRICYDVEYIKCQIMLINLSDTGLNELRGHTVVTREHRTYNELIK